MSIVKKPFINYTLEEDKSIDKGKILTVRLNEQEYFDLQKVQNLLQQEKESTVLKQVFLIGIHFVLHFPPALYLVKLLGGNIRKNKRLGIDLVDIKE